MIIHTVVNGSQTVSVQPVQGGLTFVQWADGVQGTSHPFIVGTTPVTFTAQYVNRPPVAVVQASPVTGNAPLTVVFDGSGSSDPELTTLVYSWDFGDGTTSTETSPVHTYTAAGTYQAVLTVTDQRNGSASQPVTITVNPPPATCGNGHLDAGEACDGGACAPGSVRQRSRVCAGRRAWRSGGDVHWHQRDVSRLLSSGSRGRLPAPATSRRPLGLVAPVRPRPSRTGRVRRRQPLQRQTCQNGACTPGTALVRGATTTSHTTRATPTGCTLHQQHRLHHGIREATCAGGLPAIRRARRARFCNSWRCDPSASTLRSGPARRFRGHHRRRWAHRAGCSSALDTAGYITGIASTGRAERRHPRRQPVVEHGAGWRQRRSPARRHRDGNR